MKAASLFVLACASIVATPATAQRDEKQKPTTQIEIELDDDTVAARCRTAATQVATHVGGALGRQTDLLFISITNTIASDFTYRCHSSSPYIAIGWVDTLPSRAIEELFAKAGSFLTGASPEQIKSEHAKCLKTAVGPSGNGVAVREFGDVRIECHAIERQFIGSSTILNKSQPKLRSAQLYMGRSR